ncbi:MAG: DsbA family protein [Azospirillaceae bacterium]|nr:DsbA family protein [Azospirillaceae bacterium]
MLRRLLLTSLIVVAGLSTTAPAGAENAAPAVDKAAIETIVHDYLLHHPEVILESVEALRKQEAAAADVEQRTALASRQQELFHDQNAPVVGNPAGDVTVVEFTDYQCGYCKASYADVTRLVTDDGHIRLVFKEFPILGPASVTAAKVALAARKQNKYAEVRDALMTHRGPLDEDTVLHLAADAGANRDQLKHDMDDPAIAQTISANLKLADALGINGTPAFVIGDQVYPGVMALQAMKELVANARKPG